MTRILFLLLLPTILQAQVSAIKVPVSIWGHQANALVYTPAEYADSANKRYPTILFFHGRGEAGTNISLLYNNGPFRRIKEQGSLSVVNPVTGNREHFIVIGVQGTYWPPDPPAMDIAYKELLTRYRIDTTRVYTTGLSAGGQSAIMFANWDTTYSRRIAAVVAASPSSIYQQSLDNLKLFADQKIPVWMRVGDNDLTGPFLSDATRYRDIIEVFGGAAILQTFSGGHCCWDDLYYSRAKIAAAGQQLDMYEWFLMHSKKAVPPAEPEPPALKYIKILHDPEKVARIIVLDKDGKWTEYTETSVESADIKLEKL